MKNDLPRQGYSVRDRHPWTYQSFLCRVFRNTLLAARASMMKERAELLEQLNSGSLSEEDRFQLANSTIWTLENEIEEIERLIGIPPKEITPDPRVRVYYEVGDKIKVRQRPTLGYPQVGREGTVARIIDTQDWSRESWTYEHPIQVEFDVSEKPAGTNDFTAARGDKAYYWFAPTEIEHVDPLINDERWNKIKTTLTD